MFLLEGFCDELFCVVAILALLNYQMTIQFKSHLNCSISCHTQWHITFSNAKYNTVQMTLARISQKSQQLFLHLWICKWLCHSLNIQRQVVALCFGGKLYYIFPTQCLVAFSQYSLSFFFSKKSGFPDHTGSCTVTSCAIIILTYLHDIYQLKRWCELMWIRRGNCQSIVTYQFPWLYSVSPNVNLCSGVDMNYIIYIDLFFLKCLFISITFSHFSLT